jgi:hypothetical protein
LGKGWAGSEEQGSRENGGFTGVHFGYSWSGVMTGQLLPARWIGTCSGNLWRSVEALVRPVGGNFRAAIVVPDGVSEAQEAAAMCAQVAHATS